MIEEFSPTCPGRLRMFGSDSELPSLDVRQVLKNKIWATSSENWSRDGIAAWFWLTRGHEVRRGLPSEYSLSAAKFSRLVAVADVILSDAGGPWLSLGHSTWSLMVLPE